MESRLFVRGLVRSPCRCETQSGRADRTRGRTSRAATVSNPYRAHGWRTRLRPSECASAGRCSDIMNSNTNVRPGVERAERGTCHTDERCRLLGCDPKEEPRKRDDRGPIVPLSQPANTLVSNALSGDEHLVEGGGARPASKEGDDRLQTARCPRCCGVTATRSRDCAVSVCWQGEARPQTDRGVPFR